MQTSAPKLAYRRHFERRVGRATAPELAAAGCAPLVTDGDTPRLVAATGGGLAAAAAAGADPVVEAASRTDSPTSNVGVRPDCSSRSTRFRSARISAAF